MYIEHTVHTGRPVLTVYSILAKWVVMNVFSSGSAPVAQCLDGQEQVLMRWPYIYQLCGGKVK